MAIFISGWTPCPICSLVVFEAEPYLGFPAFLRREHSLWPLSDAIVHQHCFDTWKHRETFSQLLEAFRDLHASRPKDLTWKDGEVWMNARVKDFDIFAKALDPANVDEKDKNSLR
jgi:hypothetical protein